VYFFKERYYSKDTYFSFSTESVSIERKNQLSCLEGHRSAVPSAFIFVRVFVADALAAHAGFCFCFD